MGNEFHRSLSLLFFFFFFFFLSVRRVVVVVQGERTKAKVLVLIAVRGEEGEEDRLTPSFVRHQHLTFVTVGQRDCTVLIQFHSKEVHQTER